MRKDTKSILIPADTLEWLTVVLWLILWAFMTASALAFPGTIPIHYEAGQPDRYAGFAEMMIIPVLVSLMNVLLIYLARFIGRGKEYSSVVIRDAILILTIGINILVLFMAFSIIWASA
ncbi:MAG: hypothetical protein GX137_05235 [Thermoplasmatales archaeon]|jgi:hypothetical protein|nr:hypothetical protein [Thermoplasmatales archaeon]